MPNLKLHSMFGLVTGSIDLTSRGYCLFVRLEPIARTAQKPTTLTQSGFKTRAEAHASWEKLSTYLENKLLELNKE